MSKQTKRDNLGEQVITTVGESDPDHCPICAAMYQAELKGRQPTVTEIEQAFKLAKELGLG